MFLLDSLLCKLYLKKQQYALFAEYHGNCAQVKKLINIINSINQYPHCIIEILDDKLPTHNWLGENIDYTISSIKESTFEYKSSKFLSFNTV
jgi:hypothetical protein